MTEFHDPFDEMTDDEFDEDTARLFSRPMTTITLAIPVEFLQRIEALAKKRSGQPVQQLMVRALNLGVRQIEEEKPRRLSDPDR